MLKIFVTFLSHLIIFCFHSIDFTLFICNAYNFSLFVVLLIRCYIVNWRRFIALFNWFFIFLAFVKIESKIYLFRSHKEWLKLSSLVVINCCNTAQSIFQLSIWQKYLCAFKMMAEIYQSNMVHSIDILICNTLWVQITEHNTKFAMAVPNYWK